MQPYQLKNYAIPHSSINLILDYALETSKKDSRYEEIKGKFRVNLLKFFTPLSISVDAHFEMDRLVREKTEKDYKPHCKSHFENSQKAMLSGAQGLKGHLVIIAPDALEKEILPKLAANFQQITLLAYSYKSLNDCYDAVSPHTNSRIRLLHIDLTESSSLIEANLYEAVNTGMSFDDTLKLLASSIQRVANSKFKSSLRRVGKADYVISSLVCTQLYYLLYTYCKENLCELRPSKQFSVTEESKLRDFRALMQQLFQAKHLSDLSLITKPQSGRLYLADTVKDLITKQDICDVAFFEAMNKSFQCLHKGKWKWGVTSSDSNDASIKYQIEQFILTPLT